MFLKRNESKVLRTEAAENAVKNAMSGIKSEKKTRLQYADESSMNPFFASFVLFSHVDNFSGFKWAFSRWEPHSVQSKPQEMQTSESTKCNFAT